MVDGPNELMTCHVTSDDMSRDTCAGQCQTGRMVCAAVAMTAARAAVPTSVHV